MLNKRQFINLIKGSSLVLSTGFGLLLLALGFQWFLATRTYSYHASRKPTVDEQLFALCSQPNTGNSRATTDETVTAPIGLLLKQGANINARGTNNRTPLIEAAAVGNVTVVAYLLRHGANPNLCSTGPHGGTALEVARYTERNIDKGWNGRIAVYILAEDECYLTVIDLLKHV